MIVRSFLSQDLMRIALQPHQRGIRVECATEAYAAELAKSGPVFTAESQGEIVAVAGLIEQWPGCMRAYAFLGEHAGRNMVTLTRGIQKYFREHPVRRIEAAVECSFEAGVRWARMLGFQYEGRMTAYWNDRDAYLFARVT
jgi:hypothetical protein